jgi:hypothetical protein
MWSNFDKRVHQLNMVVIFYMHVGYGHDVYLLRLSTHLSLTVYLVVEEPNAWKSTTEGTYSYHSGKEKFVDQMSRVHQSTERIYTYPAFVRKEICNMWNIITHTLVRVTVVSTSGHTRMSWLFDVRLFMVVSSQNGKMMRNQSIGTITIRVLISIIPHANNIF